MNNLRNLVLSAMFVAVGIVLPFLTGQVPQIGNMLLPMHIPVFLCGLICGWQYGVTVGGILPLLRSFLFGMPLLYPNAIAMAFELAAYGFVVGFLYHRVKRQNMLTIYGSMLVAMVAGRVVWGIAEVFLIGMGEGGFGWQMFVAGAFMNAIPGIILQLILIPSLLSVLHLTGLLRFKERER